MAMKQDVRMLLMYARDVAAGAQTCAEENTGVNNAEAQRFVTGCLALVAFTLDALDAHLSKNDFGDSIPVSMTISAARCEE